MAQWLIGTDILPEYPGLIPNTNKVFTTRIPVPGDLSPTPPSPIMDSSGTRHAHGKET